MDLNRILKTNYKFSDKTIHIIEQENKDKIAQKLSDLNLKKPDAGQLYQALIYKVSEAEHELLEYLGHIDCGTQDGMRTLLEEAARLFPPKLGFFLKENKAKEMLILHPPKKLIKMLGYSDINTLLSKENLYEIYGSLRFVETNKWMHDFLKQYDKLTADDFEKRRIKLNILNKRRWQDAGKEFVKKKFHNLTHLKELGVLFALPRPASDELGIALTTFSLALHYFNEISMYSSIFANLKNKPDFGKKIIPILKGEPKKNDWLIIPRYLEKQKNPPAELYKPHINPEAIFWRKATQNLMKLAQELPGGCLDFWGELNWIADYFPGPDKKDYLITFNFEDISMSFANQLSLKKHYIYHFREALWNRVFEIEKGDIEKHFLATYNK